MSATLIIEDDVDLAELIKENLESAGYKVYIAYTGSQGINIFNNKNPDAITLDMHLPDIDGLDLLKMFKENGKSIVIVVTCDDAMEEKSKDYNADGFISKPINFSKLKELLKSKV